LATNVAESSLTVPGIRFVIDTGTARISHYSPRRKVQRLPIEAVSRASADQRAGRCGRIGPGICVRLYSEVDYQTRDRYTLPEIRRTNLASVILQTKAMRLGELEDFPFLDPPRADAIRDGYKTLFELGALDERRG
jgi:ATP-dependent helicase HrpA